MDSAGPILETALLKVLPTWSDWKLGYRPLGFLNSLTPLRPACLCLTAAWVWGHGCLPTFCPSAPECSRQLRTLGCPTIWISEHGVKPELWCRSCDPLVTLGILSFNLENNTLGGKYSHFYLWGIETQKVVITCPEVNGRTGIWTQD